MNGHVDEELRALIDISVSARVQGEAASLTVWIDTAFNGGLVSPRTQIGCTGTQKVVFDGSDSYGRPDD